VLVSVLESSSRCSIRLLVLPGDQEDEARSILIEVASWGLYLAVIPSHVGAMVDGLAHPMHQPMVHSCQPRG
jgi:hypothetical protein